MYCTELALVGLLLLLPWAVGHLLGRGGFNMRAVLLWKALSLWLATACSNKPEKDGWFKPLCMFPGGGRAAAHCLRNPIHPIVQGAPSHAVVGPWRLGAPLKCLFCAICACVRERTRVKAG